MPFWSGNPADGNTGHKRCKYCGVDNWAHSAPDCPGMGTPIPVTPDPIMFRKTYTRKAKPLEDYAALWCTPGDHSFPANDPDKEVFSRTAKTGKTDDYGDPITKTVQFAVCGKHANGVVGAPKSVTAEAE